MLMDGDIISPASCVRQPFSSSEIGLSKAAIMIGRLNLFWGLNWTASSEFLSEQSKIGVIERKPIGGDNIPRRHKHGQAARV